MDNNDRIPTPEEWFFYYCNPTEDEKAEYFIMKKKAEEEEKMRQSEFILWQTATEQINKLRNKNIKEILNSFSVPSFVSSDWTTIR